MLGDCINPYCSGAIGFSPKEDANQRKIIHIHNVPSAKCPPPYSAILAAERSNRVGPNLVMTNRGYTDFETSNVRVG